MKKLILSFALTIIGPLFYAQNTAKDVFTKDQLVWYGLDFSKSKMVGQFDQAMGEAPATGEDIKAKYIPSWNGLVFTEAKKYDLKKTFRKSEVFNDLSAVEKNNAKIDANKFLVYNDYKFENPTSVVNEVVTSLAPGDKKEGIGLVFVVEYFNKIEQKASVYVTFFDIATKKVLFTEQEFTKPGGFGVRNYWAGAIKNILTRIDKDDYGLWKNKYGK